MAKRTDRKHRTDQWMASRCAKDGEILLE